MSGTTDSRGEVWRPVPLWNPLQPDGRQGWRCASTWLVIQLWNSCMASLPWNIRIQVWRFKALNFSIVFSCLLKIGGFPEQWLWSVVRCLLFPFTPTDFRSGFQSHADKGNFSPILGYVQRKKVKALIFLFVDLQCAAYFGSSLSAAWSYSLVTYHAAVMMTSCSGVQITLIFLAKYRPSGFWMLCCFFFFFLRIFLDDIEPMSGVTFSWCVQYWWQGGVAAMPQLCSRYVRFFAEPFASLPVLLLAMSGPGLLGALDLATSTLHTQVSHDLTPQQGGCMGCSLACDKAPKYTGGFLGGMC